MQLTRARRLIAGAAVATAVLAAAPAPASAALAAADISMYVVDTTVPVGAGVTTPVDTILAATDAVVLEEPTLTYRIGGLGGVRLTGEEGIGECENESPSVLVCSSPFPLELGPDGIAGVFRAYLGARDATEIGETGTITATLSARGLAPVSFEARVRVAESVDLQAGPEQRATAAPGATFDAPLVVTNAGDTVITGASVTFDHDFAIDSTVRYRNCLYIRERLHSCTFDQDLQAGRTYAAAMPLKIRADTAAPDNAYGYRRWLTPAELEDFHTYLKSRDLSPGTPGDGDVLTLAERPAAKDTAQADADIEDNWSELQVRVPGENGIDLAATGAKLTGKAGDRLTVPVGVRNVGEATLDLSRLGSPAAVTEVTVPRGTTAVAASPECYPVSGGEVDFDAPGRPGAAAYECHSDFVLAAGAEEVYEFELRIDRIAGRATGAVAVNEPCECERFADDVDTSNNTAAIVISDGTTGGDGQGGGSGDDDPTLPITGPQGMTLAGAGAALLVLGVAGFVLARRRRTTFVS